MIPKKDLAFCMLVITEVIIRFEQRIADQQIHNFTRQLYSCLIIERVADYIATKYNCSALLYEYEQFIKTVVYPDEWKHHEALPPELRGKVADPFDTFFEIQFTKASNHARCVGLRRFLTHLKELAAAPAPTIKTHPLNPPETYHG
jgi:hypothetical protein